MIRRRMRAGWFVSPDEMTNCGAWTCRVRVACEPLQTGPHKTSRTPGERADLASRAGSSEHAPAHRPQAAEAAKAAATETRSRALARHMRARVAPCVLPIRSAISGPLMPSAARTSALRSDGRSVASTPCSSPSRSCSRTIVSGWSGVDRSTNRGARRRATVVRRARLIATFDAARQSQAPALSGRRPSRASLRRRMNASWVTSAAASESRVVRMAEANVVDACCRYAASTNCAAAAAPVANRRGSIDTLCALRAIAVIWWIRSEQRVLGRPVGRRRSRGSPGEA